MQQAVCHCTSVSRHVLLQLGRGAAAAEIMCTEIYLCFFLSERTQDVVLVMHISVYNEGLEYNPSDLRRPTHCNTLHYTATHTLPSVCTTRVSSAMLSQNDSVMRVTPLLCILHYNHDHTLHHTAPHCNTLQHARTRLAGSPTYHDQHDSLASLGVFPRGFLCVAVRCSMFQCVAVCCSVCCFVLLT